MNNLVSIIVPMHNVEPYIEECLSSILAQTHSNLEIIVVDDNSTDRSLDIATDFAKRDNRFKIIHSATSLGSSAARNVGLDFANIGGDLKYIAFVDSDDFIDSNFIALLLDNLLESNADICVCDFLTGDKPTLKKAPRDLIGEDIMSAYIRDGLNGRIFNKLYTREVIGNVRFPVGRNMMEDGVFTPKVLLKAKKVRRIDETPYHYRIRQDSLMNRPRTLKDEWEHFLNEIERYDILLGVVDRQADLEKIVGDIRFIVMAWLPSESEFGLIIFNWFKELTMKFEPKLRSAVRTGTIEEFVLNLLVNESDARIARGKLLQLLNHMRR